MTMDPILLFRKGSEARYVRRLKAYAQSFRVKLTSGPDTADLSH